ncbi:reactive oxygen species modulator 1-like [Phyllostomus discolor]|uniref:Reactive oxygen species modulator 1 n=1 Tax=Phyllostomus discolor TaxID=89673 RepID=A0A7E6D1H9_9CHIR|nr:reactive oxygen species modulator 1-like [Phyllostomus discolor]
MPVAIGPYGKSQPSCFNHTKMDFIMGYTMGMVAGTFSCLRIGMHDQELMGSIRKTMMQSGSTFGTFMAIKMGPDSNQGSGCPHLPDFVRPNPCTIVKRLSKKKVL